MANYKAYFTYSDLTIEALTVFDIDFYMPTDAMFDAIVEAMKIVKGVVYSEDYYPFFNGIRLFNITHAKDNYLGEEIFTCNF